ncbi:PREDICTED: uncharacterized protein LOC105154867 [Acromyrmex echinatior]|uniref:uncharacterized protein LOC105154867 n=1 Tax=Acromyrmex echinatior TaxID=103372 RepID=UPI000580C1B6|nr:PREDICTED: uncharacterized protein LOC105154867 [Acromyrmex echinatior]
MVNEDVKVRIIDFKVNVRVNSDYLPLCLKIREQEEEEKNPTTEAERELLDSEEAEGEETEVEDESIELEEEEELKEEEIKKILRKMKLRKTADIERIPTEVQKYAGKRLDEAGIFNEDGVEKRRVSLLCTAFKLYAEMLKNKLEKEAEKKRMISETRREGSKKGENGKVFMFVDLKAAFDKVDRGKLWDCLRKKGISESLVRRIEKTYEEIEVTVKMKLGNTES